MTKMASSDHDDGGNSSSDDGARLPGGLGRKNENKRQRGWQGSEMELEHQREILNSKESGREIAKSAAVDISQFQNFEVGQGYQAKHVVRQKGGAMGTTAAGGGGDTGQKVTVASMPTKPEDYASETRKKKKSKQEDDRSLESYLQCSGLREFRKEIEKILAS